MTKSTMAHGASPLPHAIDHCPFCGKKKGEVAA